MPAPKFSEKWFWLIITGLLVIIVGLIIRLINGRSGWEFWTFMIIGVVEILIGIYLREKRYGCIKNVKVQNKNR